MNKKPTVSIITASYNHADFIGAAVESVLRQDYETWELIIADDSSTDNTLEVLDAYKDDKRIKVSPFSFNRQSHMRNFAAEHTKGTYIAFLNSDDIFFPEKISKQVEYLEKEVRCAAVFTHVKLLEGKNKTLEKYNLEKIFAVKNQDRHQWLRRFFVSGNCLCISSAMMRRNFFEELGKFNPLLIQVADLDLWIRTCLKADIHIIPEQLTGMRILNKGQNLSSPSPSSSSRSFLEYQQVYDHYFSVSGLEQMPEIFPEFKAMLSRENWERRYYLLCRIAAFLPQRHMRFLGFAKLHKLLEDKYIRISLLGRNPRLLRTIFFSEGTAGLDADYPGVMWNLSFFDHDGFNRGAESYSYWTADASDDIVCLSFSNPGISAVLCLKMTGNFIPLKCSEFNLYNQETGERIFASRENLTATNGKIKRKGNFFQIPRIQKHGWRFYFPEIDYAAVSSEWIDMEITCSPVQFYIFFRYARRLFSAPGRLLQSLNK